MSDKTENQDPNLRPPDDDPPPPPPMPPPLAPDEAEDEKLSSISYDGVGNHQARIVVCGSSRLPRIVVCGSSRLAVLGQ